MTQTRARERRELERKRAHEKEEKQGLKEELKEILKKIEEKKRQNEEENKKEAKEGEEATEAKTAEKEDKGETPYRCGGVTEKYIWNQTLIDLVVTIPIPKELKAEDFNVHIDDKRLHVSIKGQEATPILDGDWHDRISPSECLWTIETYEGAGKTLSLTIQKFPEFQGWWECVVNGEPKIDIGKVQPEDNNMEHLDPEVQMEVQKALFDQRQKTLGLPTIEEMENQKKLEELFQKNPSLRQQFAGAKMASAPK